MLVSLGARNQVDELVDLLAACHRRIRHHVVLARRLVVRGADSPIDDVCATAAQIRRYFTVALPLHVADEDETIAPRLAALGNPVAAALNTMAVDHVNHQHLIDRLVELCGEIEQSPAQLKRINGQLSRLVEVLATELAAHLELEERVVFPALRALGEAQRADILAAMRQRRQSGHEPSPAPR